MNGWIFVDRLSPYAVHFTIWGHSFGIRWYGLAYVLGFVLAAVWFRRAARRRETPGLSPEAVESLLFGLVLGVLVGGRLGFVLQHPRELAADPLMAIRVWEGGMAFFGGLAGVLLALLWVSRRYGVRFLAMTDIAAFPAALALGIGRIANFINGELVGRPTGSNWGVIFPAVDNLPRYPSQLFESASHFLLFGLLVFVASRYAGWTRERAGRLSFLFLAGYGLLRFITDFYRADETYLGPFSTGQWASLGTGLAGLMLLAWWSRRVGRAAGSEAARTNRQKPVA